MSVILSETYMKNKNKHHFTETLFAACDKIKQALLIIFFLYSIRCIKLNIQNLMKSLCVCIEERQ